MLLEDYISCDNQNALTINILPLGLDFFVSK